MPLFLSLRLVCCSAELLPNLLQYNAKPPLINLYPQCCPRPDNNLFWAAHQSASGLPPSQSFATVGLQPPSIYAKADHHCCSASRVTNYSCYLSTPELAITAAGHICSWSWRLCIMASVTAPSLHKVNRARAPAHHVLLLQDPITGKPAVLVIVHNITQQKRLELQLAQRHEALQR